MQEITLLVILFVFALTTFGCDKDSEAVEAKENLNGSGTGEIVPKV